MAWQMTSRLSFNVNFLRQISTSFKHNEVVNSSVFQLVLYDKDLKLRGKRTEPERAEK